MTFPSDSTMPDIEEKTEVIYGEENTVKKALHDFLSLFQLSQLERP